MTEIEGGGEGDEEGTCACWLGWVLDSLLMLKINYMCNRVVREKCRGGVNKEKEARL